MGIGTVDPNPNAKLDISSTLEEPGGLLLPRVALLATTNSSPLTGTIENGMIVYNTATAGSGATRVTPGFYYHDGAQWVRIIGSTAPKDNWQLVGNAGTNITDNFLGTTDSQPLRIRTNGNFRFEFTTNGRLRSENDGSAAEPTYSWFGNNKQNMGMFRSGANGIGFSTSGVERFRIPTADQVHAMSNGSASYPFYSWSSNPRTGMFQQAANVLGFSTNGTERFRIPNSNQVHAMNNGSATNPFYSWGTTNNNNTGMFLPALRTLGFSTNGGERMRILSDGRITINDTGAFNFMLNSTAGGSTGAIIGESTNGTAVQGQSLGDGDAVVGVAVGTGDGVVGESLLNDGVMGYTAGTGVASGVFGLSDNQAFGGWFSSTTLVGTPGSGTALIGAMGLNAITNPNGSGVAANGVKNGIYASASAFETGAGNSGNAGGEFTLGTNPTGGTNTVRSRASIAGYHRGQILGQGGNNTDSYYGGFFAGGVGTFNTDPSYAYVGIKFNANTLGQGETNYKIIGNGTVSTLVDDSEGNKRILFAPEAPEILFEDYGVGQLKNGSIYIEIDPLFAKSIFVSQKYPLKVFVQLEGECNGVYVTEKTANGFYVKELNGGMSNTPFSYHLVANRADDIAKDGSVASKHVGLRFPIGPGPLEMAKMKTVEVKEAKSKTVIEKKNIDSVVNSQSEIQTIEGNTSPNVGIQEIQVKSAETKDSLRQMNSEQ